jgi:hypothetical protein
MNVREILTEYLKTHEYDGIYNPESECSCELADLMPCDLFDESGCVAGHKVRCDYKSRIRRGLEPECDGDCKWHMVPGPRPRGPMAYSGDTTKT